MLCTLNLSRAVCQVYVRETGRKRGQGAVEGLVGTEHSLFLRGVPWSLPAGIRALGDFCKMVLPSVVRGENCQSPSSSLLPPEKQLALSKQVVLSCWDFESCLAKNKSIVENPQRWSASLTSRGGATHPRVRGAGLPALIISSSLGSGGVAWLFSATWAACWFPGTPERKTQILL